MVGLSVLSVFFAVCLSVCMPASANLLVSMTACLSTCNLSVSLSMCLFLSVNLSLKVRLSCPSFSATYPSVCMPVSTILSVCLGSAKWYLEAHLFCLALLVCLYDYLCKSVTLYVCVSTISLLVEDNQSSIG